MPTLRSHTHLQAAQANAQTKACKRVCLPNRTDITTLDRRATTVKEGRTFRSEYDRHSLLDVMYFSHERIRFSGNYGVSIHQNFDRKGHLY
jgi:hypothetical protein